MPLNQSAWIKRFLKLWARTTTTIRFTRDNPADAQAQAEYDQLSTELNAVNTAVGDAQAVATKAQPNLAQAKVDQDRLNKDGGLETTSPDEDKPKPQVPNETQPAGTPGDAKKDTKTALPSTDENDVTPVQPEVNETHVESDSSRRGVTQDSDKPATPKSDTKNIGVENVPTSSTQQNAKSEKKLPNTGSSQTGFLTILGSLLRASVSGLWFRKRQLLNTKKLLMLYISSFYFTLALYLV
ncbi:LPXTG cell wall anchor domain-containing protein [Weissella viridescens]|uniref:LPXTG cell wall anchor domain-containing protein n=1 Tax=Weissella viridescens TaxID=1629 RepID=A0A3P2RBZ1_WEIVI|nr:LPXTG cell wall anchor domain-containing protein [Weissella viridescens]RRG18074.1 LPXTG cell wall anchor domain-containing protein [Weissella viridescens]